jgi:hypothetical protein
MPKQNKRITRLEELASKTAWSDDPEFNAWEFSGNNFDDAYAGGVQDGEILLARELLAMIRDGV